MIIDNISNNNHNISNNNHNISNNNHKGNFQSQDNQKDSGNRQRNFLIASAFLVIVSTSFLAGILVNKQGIIADLKANFNVIATGKYFKALFYSPELPTLQIDMKFKHFKKIEAKREEALERGILFASDEDLVPAKIQFQGRTIPVKMRLKGDFTDHLNGDKWSYRIQVKGNDQLLGMRRFSIQHPKVRRYLYEWAWLENLRREGVLALRYQFVNVVFNGKSKGVFALEEHFSKELLESQQRREGVIIKFDEELFWQYHEKNSLIDTDNFRTAQIITRRNSRVTKNPVLSRERDTAMVLLKAFQEGKLPASEIFDVSLMAKFLAACNLWNARHSLDWTDMNFYYNPITAKLEPIGFDGNHIIQYLDNRISLLDFVRQEDDNYFWLSQVLQDPAIAEAYIKELYRIAQPEYLEQLKAELNESLEKWQFALYRDLPLDHSAKDGLFVSVWDSLKSRQESIRRSLDEKNTILAFAHRKGHGDNSLQVEVRSLLTERVEVLGFKIGEQFINADSSWVNSSGQIYNRDGESTVVLPIAQPPGKYMRPVETARFHISVGADSNQQTSKDSQTPEIKVVTRLLGLSASYELPVHPYLQNLTENPIPDAPNVEQALAQYPFLEQGETQNVLRLKKGEWDVKGDLVLPEGMRLQAQPGTRLSFEQDAIFISRGPLEFLGTAKDPIVLEPKQDSWGGMVVLEAGAPSQWEYVVVKNTRGIGPGVNPRGVDRQGWILTGGINFYRSPISLYYCRILGSEAEDGINIVRSSFEFKHSEFAGVTSDAFDGDFVEGIIEASGFHDVAGDAIDVSGSKVQIRKVALRDVGDKAISAGEGSQIHATDIKSINSGIGVASKDLSQVQLDRAVIENAKHAGLASYEKKPEFGPANITATNVDFTNTQQNTLVQTGSWIELDKEKIEGTEIDVKAMYQAGILGN